MTWRDYLLLDLPIFLRECDLAHTRGSGPGGQKRNKTSSAVRITHRPTGISVRAEETRSQKANLKHAINRLRIAIALQIRDVVATQDVSVLLADLPVSFDQFRSSNVCHLAIMMDYLHAAGYSLSEAAKLLGVTTGAVSRFICSSEPLMTEVNRQRAARNLKPLRSDR